MKKPTWEEYFVNMLDSVGLRSGCDRGRCACIITYDNRIISTGYSAPPRGLPDCFAEGHLLQQVDNGDGLKPSSHCVRNVHAEQNAIIHAARFGISLEGATLYVSMSPCSTCAKLIIGAGIKRVIAKKMYQKEEPVNLLKTVGIEFDVINSEVEQY